MRCWVWMKKRMKEGLGMWRGNRGSGCKVESNMFGVRRMVDMGECRGVDK